MYPYFRGSIDNVASTKGGLWNESGQDPNPMHCKFSGNKALWSQVDLGVEQIKCKLLSSDVVGANSAIATQGFHVFE